MFDTRIRFLLILGFLLIGVVLQVKLGFASPWYLYAAAALLLFTHFRFGNVSAAFVHLRRGKLDKAEELLDQIKRPEWLAKRHLAYYHFTKGLLATQHKELTEGEEHLKEALKIGLRSANDNALAALNMAHICFVNNRKDEAKQHLEKAKSYSSNDLLIKQNIEEMEKALAAPLN